MSTFTDWNGPQGSNVRASDLAAMVKEYQGLLNALNTHIAAKPGDSNVHNIRDYLTGVLKDYEKITELDATLSSYVKSSDLTKTLSDLRNSLTDSINDKVSTDTFNEYKDYVSGTLIKDWVLSEVFNIFKNEVQTDISSINMLLDKDNLSDGFKNLTLKAVNHLEFCVHALHEIQFQDKLAKAYIGGTNTAGVYYVIGMVDTYKAGTAYIKYINDKPFTAIINWTLTNEPRAEMTVLSDSRFDNSKFMLVQGTGNDGQKHVYLVFQTTEWIPEFTSTDGKGMFSTVDFYAAGINFAPADTGHFVRNNAQCEVIAECSADIGFNASKMIIADAVISEVSTDLFKDAEGNTIFEVKHDSKIIDGEEVKTKVLVFGDKSFDVINFSKRPSVSVKVDEEEDPVDAPLVTTVDLSRNNLPIGAIVRWGLYHVDKQAVLDEDGNPVINMNGVPNPEQEDGEEAWEYIYVLEDIPDGFLACDGSDFDAAKYPTLASLYLDGKTPKEDFSIIRAAEITGSSEDSDTDTDALITHKYLNKKIDLEIAHRAEAVTSVTEKLDAEITRSTATDESHDSGIARNTAAIEDLDNRLDAEITRSTGKDNEHEASINGIKDDLDNEITDRTDADTALGTRIDNEITDRTDADTALGTRIDNEITDRTDADTALKDLITQVNKQSIQIYTGTSVSDLPAVTPDPATGNVIVTGQEALLNVSGTLTLYKATVDTDDNVTWEVV